MTAGNLYLPALLLFIVSVFPLAAESYDWDAGEIPEVELKTVQFRCFIKSGTQKVRGVVVLIPGTHGDGRNLIHDPDWRKIATEHSFAIVGCRFADGDYAKYQDDKNFIVCRTIEKAIRQFAEVSRHPEMANAPLAFQGMSAGSNLSARFCRYNPRRVIAFASCKGTRGPTRDKNGTEEVPMLFAIGAKDNPVWVENSLRNISSGLRKGALWTTALHKQEGHGIGGSLDLAKIYINSMIQLRLAENGRLQRLHKEDGWLGNPDTLEISTYKEYRGRTRDAVWLPDEATAQAWKTYLSSGP